MEFTTTESGFDGELGGASNSEGADEYHYVLFARDDPPSGDRGIYFEFDDQSHGGEDRVEKVVITGEAVEIRLKDEEEIFVKRGADDSGWDQFLRGIREVFRESGIVEG